MQVTGTGTGSTTARAISFTSASSTVALFDHRLLAGDEVSFATVVTTTGVITNTIYFVVNPAANTFQVAETLGGPAITLTNNGTGSVRFKVTVANINSGVSITLSRPATSTAAASYSFRHLKTNTALLKGWAVTG